MDKGEPGGKLIDNPEVVEDYATFVERMIDPKVQVRGSLGKLRYLAAKAVEEAAELLSILTKHEFHERDFDPRDLELEAGDMRFYNQAICNALGKPASMIEQENVRKLTERGDYAQYTARMNAERKKDADLDALAARVVEVMHANDHLPPIEQYEALIRELP